MTGAEGTGWWAARLGPLPRVTGQQEAAPPSRLPSCFSGAGARAGLGARVKFKSSRDNQHALMCPRPLWALMSVGGRLGLISQGQWPHQPKGGVALWHVSTCLCGLLAPRSHTWPLSHLAVPAFCSNDSGRTELASPLAVPGAPGLWATPHLGKS